MLAALSYCDIRLSLFRRSDLSPVPETTPADNKITFEKKDNSLCVSLTGNWNIKEDLPSPDELARHIESFPDIKYISFDTHDLKMWDSCLPSYVTKLEDYCSSHGIMVDLDNLPEGVQRLFSLASAVPETKDAKRAKKHIPFLDRIGSSTVDAGRSTMEMIEFIGDAALAFFRLLRGKARFRSCDFFLAVYECGVQALPIVSLISLLVGLILAFVGAVQLTMFGAQIYVASMVGIAMVRVMGAIMTGIIMAGRTGAAFAAQLGTMEVNEEIDALRTMGINPMEFLVLPRMLALALMMPLLCIYADLMGIVGGMIVGVGMLDLNVAEYINMTIETVSIKEFWIGLFQSSVFGVLVALSGCLRGMQCGRNSTAVGFAATSAVVTGIVSIIVSTAIITVLCNIVGI